MGRIRQNVVVEENSVPYHFLFKLCGGEEHREQVREVMCEYGITWKELPPNKFVCIGDPKYMLDPKLHEFGMSQDWSDIG